MRNRRHPTSLLTFLAVAVLTFAMVGDAFAHTVGISRGDYRILGNDVTADLFFARPELVGAVTGLDSNQDGTLSPSEITAGRAAIETMFVRGLAVRVASGLCTGTLQDVALTEEDGVAIRAIFHCPAPSPTGSAPVTLDLNFLSSLSNGHRHLAATTSGSANAHLVAYAGNAEIQMDSATGSGWMEAVGPMFLLGIRHILTGYDHLLFLLGLILVGGRIRSLMVVITAFTVAHSITLGVSALQIWSPSTRLVEPAIALSIAYIGVENWFVKDASRRWLITFPFGLIHGFGFAGALRQIALPHAEVPLALVSFNAGVEAGQLAVLAMVLPVVYWCRRKQWFLDRGVLAVSGAIACAGVWWFFIRIW